MKLTTHPQLVPGPRMMELYLHSPIHLHGMAINYLSTGLTLPYIPETNISEKLSTTFKCDIKITALLFRSTQH
jgi:hypothetical protein